MFVAIWLILLTTVAGPPPKPSSKLPAKVTGASWCCRYHSVLLCCFHISFGVLLNF